jgi:hypothetical protein
MRVAFWQRERVSQLCWEVDWEFLLLLSEPELLFVELCWSFVIREPGKKF